jgi:hypothetical protein
MACCRGEITCNGVDTTGIQRPMQLPPADPTGVALAARAQELFDLLVELVDPVCTSCKTQQATHSEHVPIYYYTYH